MKENFIAHPSICTPFIYALIYIAGHEFIINFIHINFLNLCLAFNNGINTQYNLIHALDMLVMITRYIPKYRQDYPDYSLIPFHFFSSIFGCEIFIKFPQSVKQENVLFLYSVYYQA